MSSTSLNVVHLIGRLTRDPQMRVFPSGGKVAEFGVAVNERRKVGDQWTEVPLFLDCKAYSNATGRRLADTVEQFLGKGSLIYMQGKITQEVWEAKEGGKRSKLVIEATDIQFLSARGGSGNRQSQYQAEPVQAPTNQPAPQPQSQGQDAPKDEDGDIPF